ncbi:MAG: hypothetical protein ACJ77K_05670 [Bacteroidia bacterium]
MKEIVTTLSTIKLDAAEVNLRSDGIVMMRVNNNANISVKDAREMVEAAGKVGNYKKYPILIIAGKYALADKEAREFAAGAEGNRYTIAGAFVLRGLAQKLLGNAYLKVNKPVTPTAMFDNEEKAIQWLKTFL